MLHKVTVTLEMPFLLIDRGRHILFPSISHTHAHTLLLYLLPVLTQLRSDLIEQWVENLHLHAIPDKVQ